MNERIKKLRKALGLTQQEFANRIGMKRNTVANYEINRNEPSNSVVSLICREFGVCEEWLRTGKGEIFEAKPETHLDELSKEYNLDELDRQMILGYLNLNEAERKVVKQYMQGVISRTEAKPQQSKPSTVEPDEKAFDPEIEAQVERYRKHLIAKAKSKAASRRAPNEMSLEEMQAELARQYALEQDTAEELLDSGWKSYGKATG